MSAGAALAHGSFAKLRLNKTSKAVESVKTAQWDIVRNLLEWVIPASIHIPKTFLFG